MNLNVGQVVHLEVLVVHTDLHVIQFRLIVHEVPAQQSSLSDIFWKTIHGFESIGQWTDRGPGIVSREPDPPSGTWVAILQHDKEAVRISKFYLLQTEKRGQLSSADSKPWPSLRNSWGRRLIRNSQGEVQKRGQLRTNRRRTSRFRLF